MRPIRSSGFLVLLLVATSALAQDPKDPIVDLADRLIQRSSDAFAGDDLYIRIRKAITPSKLEALSDDKYDSLVLRLAFDSSAVRGEQSETNLPDPAWSSAFEKVLYDRLGVKAPKWWVNRIAAIKATDKQAVNWSFEDGPHFVPAEDIEVRMPKNVAARIEGGKVVVTVNGHSATFAREVFDFPGLKFDRRISVHATESKLFLAVYQDAPTAVPIYCVNLADGKILWRTAAKGIPRSNILGRPRQLVDLVVSEKRLYIFGIESHGAFVEAFSLETGERVLRFAEIDNAAK